MHHLLRLSVVILLVSGLAACRDALDKDDPGVVGDPPDTDVTQPDDTDDPVDTDLPALVDADDDGVPADEDCNDDDATVFPGADERCNGVDDDCDDTVDEDAVDAPSWYDDTDGDGFGDPDAVTAACEAPAGTVADATDCDDTTAEVAPGLDEVCDGLDNDCSGTVDDDALDALTFFSDTDGDGFGDPDAPLLACEAPAGAVVDDTDCDDTTQAVRPSADELCANGVDDDCDGDVDEDDAPDAPAWFRDADGDGFGDVSDAITACVVPTGYVGDATDCDDAEDDVFPGNPEVCDGLDNDCDGPVDEEATDALTFYDDVDGDGHGDPTAPTVACTQPAGTVALDDDCDDTAASAFPGGTEVCDGLDNDCDGTPDDSAVDADPFFADTDGDGFGDPLAITEACAAPAGTVADDTDCDDTRADVSPAADEVCDGSTDEDCDGTVDEDDAVDATLFHADADADGFGGSGPTTTACTAPDGFAATDDDCDDGDATVFPDAPETCDGDDEDCDGTIDEDATDALTFYADTDGDGFGDATAPTTACALPAGASPLDTDCDDTDPLTNPGAAELCGGGDEDCDGTVDEDDAADAATWYADGDGDGVGLSSPTTASCTPPAGFAPVPGDCDDDDPLAAPGLDEVCDGLDNDCDNDVDEASAVDAIAWTLDGDGDGFGVDGTEVVSCDAPSAGYAPDGGDCDDDDTATYPGAPSQCDDTDRDCDGLVDDDADGDTWSASTCGGRDCDDTDPAIFPDSNGLCAEGPSCLELLTSGYATTDGLYTLDPDGYATGEDPFETWCDMATDGGGWTLVGTVANDGTRRWDSVAAFTNPSSFGDPLQYQGSDYKNVGFNTLDALDLLVRTDEYHIGWTAILPVTPFGSFVDLEYDAGQCSTSFLTGAPDLVSSNLSSDQVDLHDLVVRPLDNNATCFPGSNENAIVGFTFSDCCWNNGLGNTQGGQATWSTHDLSMLSLANLVPSSCSGGYPCNDRGLYHNASFNSYDTSRKADWAEVWVR